MAKGEKARFPGFSVDGGDLPQRLGAEVCRLEGRPQRSLQDFLDNAPAAAHSGTHNGGDELEGVRERAGMDAQIEVARFFLPNQEEPSRRFPHPVACRRPV